MPLRQAAALDPANATVLHDLGLACLETGQFAEAIATLRQAVLVKPRYTDAHFRLGMALEHAGDAPAAIAAYDRVTELLPGHTEAWFRAGALVYVLGHREEAVGCFRRAAATGPKTSFGRLGAARAALAEERDEEAERLLRQTLALDRDNAIALDLLATLLTEAGQFEEARRCFARAIAIAPQMAGSYYELVRCRRLTAEDAGLLDEMQQALGTPVLPPQQRVRLHLALGKAAEDLGDFPRAMRHFDAADQERRHAVPFDIAAFEGVTARMIERFTPEVIAGAADPGTADETPVLIIGMPRSGTTLLEQIISSHPQVRGAGELNFWNERGAAWLAAGCPMDAAFLRAAATAYLTELRGRFADAARVTDKMPFNFIWAGLIHLALPRATIIACKRAPIDPALSIHQTHFNPYVAFPTGGPELVRYFGCFERLCAHWRQVLPAARYHEVDYEALTAGPASVIPRLIMATGLPWDDACLTPERNARMVRTPSKWQARQPIYQGDGGRWRRYQDVLGPLRPLAPA